MEDFWTRVRRSQGPSLAWGDYLTRAAPQQTTNWGQVPGLSETAGGDWGAYTPNTKPIDFMPATAATGAGPTVPTFPAQGGTAYANIARSFDPWGNWGQYGPNQGGAKKHHYSTNPDGSGGHWESDLERVYRWTNDELRGKYGVNGEGVDPKVRTETFLRNVARLKQEYANNKQDWNTSDFRDMERGEQLLAGTQQGGGDSSITVRDTGQQGGGDVVAQYSPLNDPRTPQQQAAMQAQASGAPPAAPGQQLGQPTGGGGLYNTYIGQDKAARMAALLERLGLSDPAAQYSGAGKVISGLATRMFDPWLTTQGMDPNGAPLMDNVTGMLDTFVSRMKGPGFYQGIRNDAAAGLDRLMGGASGPGVPGGPGFDPRRMDVAELQQLLSGFNELINGELSGINPWLAQAYGNRPNEALGQYKQAEQRMMADTGQYLNYYDFLQSDPRYQFLIGR